MLYIFFFLLAVPIRNVIFTLEVVYRAAFFVAALWKDIRPPNSSEDSKKHLYRKFRTTLALQGSRASAYKASDNITSWLYWINTYSYEDAFSSQCLSSIKDMISYEIYVSSLNSSEEEPNKVGK